MKKIISVLSALAMIATMAVSVNAAATEPTLSLEVSSTGKKAGDVVTVVCKYDGYDVTPYDDNEGCGAKVTGAQIRIDIPGGIGTAANNEQFLRPGVTNVSGFSTGAPQFNWDMNNNQFTFASSGIDDPFNASGTAFTISMKLNKDVTEDLEFKFNASYDQLLVYDTYEWWEGTGTVQNPVKSFVTATLEADKVAEPVLTGITLATDAETVAANTAVTFPAVTANYDIKDPEAVTAAWTLNGEAVTEFTTPAATFEDQTFVFTATYEGKTATYTVTVKALEFAATSPVGADMYFSKDGETSKVVKTFDCSVANCEDGLVTLTFAADGKTKAYENFEVAEGEATTEFKALIFNAPAGVTLTIAD